MIGEILNVSSFVDLKPYSYSKYIKLPPDAIDFDKLQIALQDSNENLTNFETIEIQFIDDANLITQQECGPLSTNIQFLNIGNSVSTDNIRCLEAQDITIFVPEYAEIKADVVNTEHLQDAISNAGAIAVSKSEPRSEGEPRAVACKVAEARAPRGGNRHAARYEVMQVGAGRLYLCTECQASYTELGELEDHLRSAHRWAGFVCGSCGLGFRRKCHLTRHHLEEHVGRVLRCAHCDKEFKRQEHLAVHLRCVHRTSERQFKCDLCEKSFYRADRLRKHRAIHDKKPQACSGCGKIFARKTNLLKHEWSCKAVVGGKKKANL